jgi:MoaA/NifB/PqqE/SkfB family radical SAM enzyme
VIVTSAAAMSTALLARLKAAGNDALIFSLHGMDAVHDETVQREGAFK